MAESILRWSLTEQPTHRSSIAAAVDEAKEVGDWAPISFDMTHKPPDFYLCPISQAPGDAFHRGTSTRLLNSGLAKTQKSRRKEETTMKLTTLAILAAILLATAPQVFASEVNLENLNTDAVQPAYAPAQVEQTIVPDQPEPAVLEQDLRG